MKRELGKIKAVRFGAIGYQNACFGLRLELGGEGWGTVAEKTGGWDTPRLSNAAWTEEDRLTAHGKMCLEVSTLLKEAKVDCVTKLIGIPVEVNFDSRNSLTGFRILTEVL